MTERPILFSAPMVRAILAGTKTQTRRIAKGAALEWLTAGFHPNFVASVENKLCPHGQPSDQLWVRETHAIVPRTAYARSEGVQQTLRPDDPYEHDAAIYREGWTRSNGGFRWRPSIHMPRWASRITLEITSVRVERLQDISEADARAEGAEEAFDTEGGYEHHPLGNYRDGFAKLWTEINGPESWAANPWVWVVEFTRTK
jgi:hypothetical protein